MGELPKPDRLGNIEEPDQPWNKADFFDALRRHDAQSQALKVLEKAVADALEPVVQFGDHQSAELMDEVSKMMLEHDRGTIDDQEYTDRLNAFREKLKSL